jgi:hypothetical protein
VSGSPVATIGAWAAAGVDERLALKGARIAAAFAWGVFGVAYRP